MILSVSRVNPSSAAPLVELFDRVAPDEGTTETHLPGLTLHRFCAPMTRTALVYEPCICLVAQGAKRAHLGDSVFEYDPMNYLVVSLPLPVEAEIIEATPDDPLLALVLRVDIGQLGQLLLELDAEGAPPRSEVGPAIFVSPMQAELRDAVIRLVCVAADRARCRILGAGTLKEVLYHMLLGEQGARLRDLALRDSGAQRIARAIRYLQNNYDHSVDVSSIADAIGMSVSNLHHSFKQVTALSPMQYLKKIRLHRARLLMLTEGLNAGDAAFKVGYGSPSQFSREFKRLFGTSPSQLRQSARAELGAG